MCYFFFPAADILTGEVITMFAGTGPNMNALQVGTWLNRHRQNAGFGPKALLDATSRLSDNILAMQEQQINTMEKKVIDKINKMLPHLDERQRRLYLASEAEALGEGGATEISRIFGIHLNTLTAGNRDLNSGEVFTTDDGKYFRTRHKGGGRKTVVEKNPENLRTLWTAVVLEIQRTH